MKRWSTWVVVALVPFGLLLYAAWWWWNQRYAGDDSDPALQDDSTVDTSTTDALNLAEPCNSAAQAVAAKWPKFRFASGRRPKSSQGAAMAANGYKIAQQNGLSAKQGTIDSIQGGDGVKAIYAASDQRDSVVAALQGLPDDATQNDCAAALTACFNQMSDADMSHISKHPSGLAFDGSVKNSNDGDDYPEFADVDALVKQQPGYHWSTPNEGGLPRWHWEFTPDA